MRCGNPVVWDRGNESCVTGIGGLRLESRSDVREADGTIPLRGWGYLLAASLITSRPLYVPHDLQALCGRRSSPHFGHLMRLGNASFQCDDRRLFFLAFDTLLFGTATCFSPFNIVSDALPHSCLVS